MTRQLKRAEFGFSYPVRGHEQALRIRRARRDKLHVLRVQFPATLARFGKPARDFIPLPAQQFRLEILQRRQAFG